MIKKKKTYLSRYCVSIVRFTCVSFSIFNRFTFLGATQSTFLLSLNRFAFDDYVILYIIIGIDCTMKY